MSSERMFVMKLLPDHVRGTVLMSTERRVLEFTVSTCHNHHVGLFTSTDTSDMAFELKLSYDDSTVRLLNSTVRDVTSQVVF